MGFDASEHGGSLVSSDKRGAARQQRGVGRTCDVVLRRSEIVFPLRPSRRSGRLRHLCLHPYEAQSAGLTSTLCREALGKLPAEAVNQGKRVSIFGHVGTPHDAGSQVDELQLESE